MSASQALKFDVRPDLCYSCLNGIQTAFSQSQFPDCLVSDEDRFFPPSLSRLKSHQLFHSHAERRHIRCPCSLNNNSINPFLKNQLFFAVKSTASRLNAHSSVENRIRPGSQKDTSEICAKKCAIQPVSFSSYPGSCRPVWQNQNLILFAV